MPLHFDRDLNSLGFATSAENAENLRLYRKRQFDDQNAELHFDHLLQDVFHLFIGYVLTWFLLLCI